VTHSPFLFRWRDALFASDLPSTTRHVLLTLSTYGDQKGRDIYPPTRTLATATGLSRRTVEGRLREADEAGWISRTHVGQGQGWKRIRYELLIPERGEADSPPTPSNVGKDVPHLPDERGEADARRGEADDVNVGKELPLTSPVTSPVTSPPTSPSPPEGESADADPDRMGADELVATWINALGSRPAGVSKQAAVAKRLTKAYDRTTIIRALDGIQQLYPHSDGEPWDLFDLEKKFTKATTARSNGRRGATTRQSELDEEDISNWNRS
jgi:hypothetical protein